MLGAHLIKAWSSTQSSIVLFSGETEVAGVTRSCAIALGFRSLFADLGLQRLSARVWTDSSAAIGICKRQGLGKLRHLDTQILWVQQRVRNNDLDVYYVPSDKNPADIFAKPNIAQARMESLLKHMGCEFRTGRPLSAPELRREGGTNIFIMKRAGLAGATDRKGLRPGGSAVKGPRSSPSKIRRVDEDDSTMSMATEDLRTRGLPHQWSEEAIASMHCDETWLEGEEYEPDDSTCLPHDSDLKNWRLSQSLLPERLEAVEDTETLVEKGTKLGQARNGKEPLLWPI